MGSRKQPNHGGSGRPFSRRTRPGEEKPTIRYEPIRSLQELDAYLNNDKVVCLLCGAEYKKLGSHISSSHAMSSEQYKEIFNIPKGRSLSGTDLKNQMSKRAKAMWSSNPKMETVRKRLKKNVKNLNGNAYKRKSTLSKEQAKQSIKIAKTKQDLLVKEKYRAIYIDLIKKAINDDVTLSSACRREGKVRVETIYRYSRSNPDDNEISLLLSKVKRKESRSLPVGIRKEQNGKYRARWSNHTIGVFDRLDVAVEARQDYLDEHELNA